MSPVPRFLYLHLHPGQPRVLERLVCLETGGRVSGQELVVPLGDLRAEEVLAECRRLGLRVIGSAVQAGDSAG